jgi:predicted SAM-dependent methyltransferase
MVSLNIGCGPVRFEGEIGVDLYRTSACDVQANIRCLPFANEGIEFIRIDHILEHQLLREAVPTIMEMYRVLKTDGIIKVGVPDIEATCKQYLETSSLEDKFYVLSVIYGGQSHDGELHHSGWSYDTLENLLKSVGFKDIVITPEERDKGLCISANARK